ncbi:MAG TPA: acyltransferase [Steroidobacteraceae bacterium]
MTRHIPSLDGLRAVSFLLVFIAHMDFVNFVPGGFGVTIFFFLSGFLITTLMRAEHDKNGFLNLRHFWLRRILRIWPSFYLVIVLTTAYTLLLEPTGTLQPRAMSAQALHVTNYWIMLHGIRGIPAGTDVYWSLAVEEHFYLVFPWLYIAMRKLQMSGRQQAVLLWTLCGIVLAWRCVLVLKMHASSDHTYLATDTRIDSILFGCALAVWNNPVLDAWKPREKYWKYIVVPASVLVLLACLAFRDPAFRETVRYSLQGAALMPIFVAAIRFPNWLPFRFLNARPVAFVGLLSYSLYLIHYPVIFAVREHAPDFSLPTQLGLSFAIAMGIAWLFYVYVEGPCAKIRKRLSD